MMRVARRRVVCRPASVFVSLAGATGLLVALCLRPSNVAAHGCSPADSAELRCERMLTNAAAKLFRAVVKCHLDEATALLAGGSSPTALSPEGSNCDAFAIAKFDGTVARLGLTGLCPAQNLSNAVGLRDAIVAQVHQDLTAVFRCPATTTTTTSTTTTTIACGNGALDPGEECDPTVQQAQCPAGYVCNGVCRCSALCGNGMINPGEQCDPPGQQAQCAAGYVCNASCQCTALCGNGTINPGEQCDPPGQQAQC